MCPLAAGQRDKSDKKDGDSAQAEKRLLATSGSATVRVKPDSARLYLTVETTAPTLAEARSKNNEHAKKVMDAVQGLKIPDLKLKSTDVQIEIIHSRDEKKKRTVPRPGLSNHQRFHRAGDCAPSPNVCHLLTIKGLRNSPPRDGE